MELARQFWFSRRFSAPPRAKRGGSPASEDLNDIEGDGVATREGLRAQRRYCWMRPRTQSTSAWFGVALIPVGSLRTYQVVVQVTDWPEGKAA